MINRLFVSAIALSALLLFAPVVDAVEPLSTEELKLHCEFYDDDPEGTDGTFCVRYIQGFIDGAVATDERVTYNIADEIDREESFSARAIRTRVGSRLDRFGPSVYADFCLGEPVALKDVVEAVIDNLLNTEYVRDMPLARDIVFTTFRNTYPCEADKD